jgi:hypothetical protein
LDGSAPELLLFSEEGSFFFSEEVSFFGAGLEPIFLSSLAIIFPNADLSIQTTERPPFGLRTIAQLAATDEERHSSANASNPFLKQNRAYSPEIFYR